MIGLREWLYTQWLLWCVAGGDQEAWRRLKALSRLRTEALGLDPAPIVRGFVEDIRLTLVGFCSGR